MSATILLRSSEAETQQHICSGKLTLLMNPPLSLIFKKIQFIVNMFEQSRSKYKEWSEFFLDLMRVTGLG